MVYFLCLGEGGKFIRIKRPSLRPEVIIKHILANYGCIAVFKNGIVYDGILKKLGKNPLRHKNSYGRSGGKEYYKYLFTLDLPEEQVLEKRFFNG